MEKNDGRPYTAAIEAAPRLAELYKALVNSGIPEQVASVVVVETWRDWMHPMPFLEPASIRI